MTSRTLTLFLIGTGWAIAPGQAPDLLQQTKQRQEVAAQMLEADVRKALQDLSQTLADKPDRAVEPLTALLARVENDATISDERKAVLRRVVNDRLRVAQMGAETKEEREAARLALESAAKARREQTERLAKERTAVREGLKQVEQFRKDGKKAEAAKKLAELVRDYPANTAIQFLTGALQNAVSLKADAEIRKEKEEKYVAVMRDVDRASVPAGGDIEYPKDWKERTKIRMAAVSVSDDEKRILKALNSTIPAQFKATKLQEAIDTISVLTNTTIILDPSGLEESAVTYDSPVTFNARDKVSTRLVLRSILSSLNLTYVVRGNVILVTSRARAKEMMVTKVYYMGDLVAGVGPIGGAAGVGMGLDQIQTAQNISAVIEMVTGSIDPESWEKRGGLGVIGFNQATMSLIVRQSQEVHAMIRQSLFR